MGHAPAGSLLRRRRLRVRIKRALLVVAVLVAMGLLVMAAGPAPPGIERLPTLAVRDPTFVGTLEAHLGAPVVSGNRVDLLLNGDEIFPRCSPPSAAHARPSTTRSISGRTARWRAASQRRWPS
jgi:hypothetical protein